VTKDKTGGPSIINACTSLGEESTGKPKVKIINSKSKGQSGSKGNGGN
jgi:hypothetical protein